MSYRAVQKYQLPTNELYSSAKAAIAKIPFLLMVMRK